MYWKIPVAILSVILVFLAVNAFAFAVAGSDLVFYRFFAPKYAEVQREVFQNTPSYVNGMQQELDSMHLEWSTADDAHKSLIESIALQRASTMDNKDLSPDLQVWISQLKAKQMQTTTKY